MRAIVCPGRLQGKVEAIPSKSQAHRLLIAAALCGEQTRILCPELSDDIERTAGCLKALGADIRHERGAYLVKPAHLLGEAALDCGESGSTYRFMLPVCAALGGRYTFLLRGRLPERPMQTLFEALEGSGLRINGGGSECVCMEGRLQGARFRLSGDTSSQFISGLLLASPLLEGDKQIVITTPLRSAAYVEMTLEALRLFGIDASLENDVLTVREGAYRSPGETAAEGDWSGAGFWLCGAPAGGGEVWMSGLSSVSSQGDRRVLDFLRLFGGEAEWKDGRVLARGGSLRGARIDIDQTPDLAPCLALLGTAARGETRLENIARLRIKESDRAEAIVAALSALGADIRVIEDAILIRGGRPLRGGVCDARGDHRIAMMAACAAAQSQGPVIIRGAQAVSKSYPRFFDDLRSMGLEARLEAD